MDDLASAVRSGVPFQVRVTPRGGRNEVTVEGGEVRVRVTAVPEGGKANKAVQTVLAKALGVAKSRVTLVRGGSSRDKVFQLD